MEEAETLRYNGKIRGKIRTILGLSKKTKKLKTITRNNSLPHTKYKINKANKKSITPFERGLALAAKTTSTWNSQPNPSQVYIFDRRVHHGEIGVLLGLYGLHKNDPELFGLGIGLALDDIHDVNEWFTFKQRNYSNNYFSTANTLDGVVF